MSDFIDDYMKDELGQGETLSSYAEALLNESATSIDTYQLSLFDDLIIRKNQISKEEFNSLTYEEKEMMRNQERNCK